MQHSKLLIVRSNVYENQNQCKKNTVENKHNKIKMKEGYEFYSVQYI